MINVHELFVPVIDNNNKVTYFEALVSVQLTNSFYRECSKLNQE